MVRKTHSQVPIQMVREQFTARALFARLVLTMDPNNQQTSAWDNVAWCNLVLLAHGKLEKGGKPTRHSAFHCAMED